MEKKNEKENKISLEELKEDIGSYVEYDLNEYHHERYTTQAEGSKICEFICTLIDSVKGLQEKVDKLVVEKNNTFKESEFFNQFTNIGRDEDGRLLGNCIKCGCKGTDIIEHKCHKE